MAKHTTEAELKAWVAQGLNASQIARKLGVLPQYVSCTVRLLGLARAGDGRCKPGLADAYLQDLRTGLSMTEIGAKHGASPNSVHQSLRRAGHPTTLRELVRREQTAA